MKVLCKRNLYSCFKNGEYYIVDNIHSIFEKDDFITIRAQSPDHLNTPLYRFNYKGTVAHYVDDYIGWNELNFSDYFYDFKEIRKIKLQTIQKIAP